MSQKKVDAYKEEKRNRQQIIRKEKITRRLEMIAAALICIALVGWFGIAVVMHAKSSTPVQTETTTLNLDAVDAYTNQLYSLQDGE